MRLPPREGRRGAPFAIGVLVTPPEPGVTDREVVQADRRAERLAVALAAWRAGFFLLDTIEVDAAEAVTGPGWAQVWELAAATDTDGLFAHGLDPAAMEPMAGQLRLLVRRVDTGSR